MTSDHDQKRMEAARIKQEADNKRRELERIQADIANRQKQVQSNFEDKKHQGFQKEKLAGSSSLDDSKRAFVLKEAEKTLLDAEDEKRKANQEIEKMTNQAKAREMEVKDIERMAYKLEAEA